MPASYPGLTAVGGTQFPSPQWTDAGVLVDAGLEQVWNESDDPYSMYGLGAGGGGISAVFPRPTYQATTPTCAPVGSLPFTWDAGGMRQVPDIALSAAAGTPGYLIVCTVSGEDCTPAGGAPEGIVIGGTSASSPSFTGVVAIMNQAAGTRLGNINPLLYSLAAQNLTPSPFRDITSGNNEVVCGQAAAGDAGGPGDAGWPDSGCAPSGLHGFVATTGYDCASGLGSINAYNLVNAVIGLSKTTTALVAAPVVTSEGSPVALTATIDTVGTNSHALSGNVTFTFESYTTTGAVDLSWELGTVALTGASATTAQATLSTPIPPGLVKPGQQWVDVVAVYAGDTQHYGSTSAKVGIEFQPLSFAVNPATSTMQPLATQTFTSTGGITPVRWYVDYDSTAGRVNADGGGHHFLSATIDETTGVLTAGPMVGYIEITAVDNDGAEALAYVTVGAGDAGPAPWTGDAGPYIDSGAVAPLYDAGTTKDASTAKDAAVSKDSGVVKDAGAPGHDAAEPTKDATTTPTKDAGKTEKDAAKEDGGSEGSGSSGCSCDVAGEHSSSRTAPAGAVACMALGLAALSRRKRSRR